MNKKINLRKISIILLVAYALFATLFLIIADEQIKYTSDEYYAIADIPEKDLGELTAGMSILQTFKSEHQYLNGVEGYFLTYGRENKGTIRLEVLDMSSGDILAESSVKTGGLGNGDWQLFKLSERVDAAKVKDGVLGLRFTFDGSTEGTAATMTTQAVETKGGSLSVNGKNIEGRSLCVRALQSNNSKYTVWYPIVLGGVFVCLLVFCIWNIRAEKMQKSLRD